MKPIYAVYVNDYPFACFVDFGRAVVCDLPRKEWASRGFHVRVFRGACLP